MKKVNYKQMYFESEHVRMEKCEELRDLQENSVSVKLFGYTLVLAVALLISTICLAISGDELTEKVRQWDKLRENKRIQYEYENACDNLIKVNPKGSSLYHGTCYSGRAILRTKKEIQEAIRHYELGVAHE